MDQNVAQGVYLSATHDLARDYGPAFAAHPDPLIEMRTPDRVTEPEAVEVALCWQPGPRDFTAYPNLKLIMAVSAGVDRLLAHPGRPYGVPVCRVRDPEQALQMAGFATHELMHVERQFDVMARNAKDGLWQDVPLRSPSAIRVAILGRQHGAGHRADHGDAGRRPPRGRAPPPPADPLPGGTLRTGDGSLGAATQGADYVINVLPITAQIRDVLNRELLERMRRGGGLIQMGRGEHLVEEDLMALIDEGHLAGASFDVLRQEPLPADHPYWQHPKLRITPHVASGATPHAVAAQLVQSVQELRDGQPLSFEVDPGTGY